MRIEYTDSRGQTSFRWITVNSVDIGQPAILNAYCWVRREIRTFRADRISNISDIDGEVWPAKTFFAAFGIKAKPPQRSKPAYSPSKSEAFALSSRTGGFAKLATTEAALRSDDTPSKPSWKQKAVVRLILWGAIGGGVLYLLV